MKLMTCGCAPNAQLNIDGKGYVPGCGIHQCVTPAEVQPDLSGRLASCYCGRRAPSKDYQHLAFFEHRPNQREDSYYCGCRGWD